MIESNVEIESEHVVKGNATHIRWRWKFLDSGEWSEWCASEAMVRAQILEALQNLEDAPKRKSP